MCKYIASIESSVNVHYGYYPYRYNPLFSCCVVMNTHYANRLRLQLERAAIACQYISFGVEGRESMESVLCYESYVFNTVLAPEPNSTI